MILITNQNYVFKQLSKNLVVHFQSVSNRKFIVRTYSAGPDGTSRRLRHGHNHDVGIVILAVTWVDQGQQEDCKNLLLSNHCEHIKAPNIQTKFSFMNESRRLLCAQSH